MKTGACIHVGRKGRIIGEDGNTLQTFKFADGKNDVADLKKGDLDKIIFVQEEEIISMLSAAGVFNAENKVANFAGRYEFVMREGKGGNSLDFSYSAIHKKYPGASKYPMDVKSSMLFLIDGMAHNHMNYGNFLFGAAGRALGLTSFELRMGAQWNSLTQSSTNGYDSQFDSIDDQRSIQKGVNHANKHGYKDMLYRAYSESLY